MQVFFVSRPGLRLFVIFFKYFVLWILNFFLSIPLNHTSGKKTQLLIHLYSINNNNETVITKIFIFFCTSWTISLLRLLCLYFYLQFNRNKQKKNEQQYYANLHQSPCVIRNWFQDLVNPTVLLLSTIDLYINTKD